MKQDAGERSRTAARRALCAALSALALSFVLPVAQAGEPIRLRVGTIVSPEGLDPERMPAVPPGPLLAPAAGRYALVQFDGPPDRAARRALAERGARTLHYVPRDTLLVSLPPGVPADSIAGLARVTYATSFRAGYNLAPALARRLAPRPEAAAERDTPAAESPVIGPPEASTLLDVLLFADQDPLLLARRLRHAFPGLGVGRIRGRRSFDPSPRLTVEVPEYLLPRVAGSLARYPVAWIERAPRRRTYNDQVVWIGQSYDTALGPVEAAEPDPKPYSVTATLWNRGLLGDGQLIAVADTGLEHAMCFFDDSQHAVTPQAVAPPAPVAIDASHRKIAALNEAVPGALAGDGAFRHGTHVAGTALGDDAAHASTATDAGHDAGDGMAPRARLLFEDIGTGRDDNCIGTMEVPSIGDLLAQEASSGAHVSSNSWGGESGEFGGSYSARTREIDGVVREHPGFLVLFAAGNEGAAGFNDYAACKNCVAVGASENHEPARGLDPENLATFSSHGPAADGRIKPDLAAPGDRVFSSRFRTLYVEDETDPRCASPGPGEEVCLRAPSLGGCYVTYTNETCGAHPLRGTSMATPAVAGLASLARQYFVDGFHPSGSGNPADPLQPSAALLKAVLVSGSRNMTGALGAAPLADAPAPTQGWGRLALDDVLYFPGDARRMLVWDIDDAGGLETGAAARFGFEVTASDEPLRLTLVWTDPAAAPFAAEALVNDLDLELAGAGDATFRGNQWAVDDPIVPNDKQSAVDPPGRDALNNVEGVLVTSPALGLWEATVRAVSVPGADGAPAQGFALVVSGAVAPGAAGTIAQATGPGLMVDKQASGEIVLSWGGSCIASDDDFAVYEGALDDLASHAPVICSTAGEPAATIPGGAGARYFLVAPHNGTHEGSLGTDSAGGLRPQSGSPCLGRALVACP